MVGLLHLAATYDCEKALGEMVLKTISKNRRLSLDAFEKKFCQKQVLKVPKVQIIQHELIHYNQFIPQSQTGDCHA